MTVALSTVATSPISTSGQDAPSSPIAAAPPAMPSASQHITTVGSTRPLPSQPQKMRPGTAMTMATENTSPAAARPCPSSVSATTK